MSPLVRKTDPPDSDPMSVASHVARQEERLLPHRAAVPKSWRRNTMPLYRFPTECYPRAIQFVPLHPQLPQALYVLGEGLGGGLGQHGWVEIDDVVFDGVLQEFYHRGAYYAVEHARPWYKFTRQATMYLDRRQKKQPAWTYRWDWTCDLPWAHPGEEPLVVDLDRAKQNNLK